MRVIIAVILVATVAFAGCASKEKDPQDEASTSTSGTGPGTTSASTSRSSTGSASGTGTGSSGTNNAPTANLTANVTSGAAPLAVNFTITGSDVDGDALVWELDLGDGSVNQTGSAVPGNLTYSFAQVGNFTVTLTVSDGTLSARANVTITTTAGSTASGFTPIHEEGSVTSLCVPCAPEVEYNTCAGIHADVNEFDCFYFDVPAEAGGRTATITSGNGFVNYEFLSDCSGSGDGLGSFVDGSGGSPLSVVLPAGIGCILLFEWADFPPEYTVDIV